MSCALVRKCVESSDRGKKRAGDRKECEKNDDVRSIGSFFFFV